MMRLDPFRDLDRLAEGLLSPVSVRSPLPMDAYRAEGELVLLLDVPGFSAEDVDVTVERDSLVISANRQRQVKEGADVIASERPHGQFVRRVLLGSQYDPDRLTASLEHGVLRISVPVSERSKPRRVEIKASGGKADVELPDQKTVEGSSQRRIESPEPVAS